MNPQQQLLQKMVLLGKITPEQMQQMQRRWMLDNSRLNEDVGPPTSLANAATAPSSFRPSGMMVPEQPPQQQSPMAPTPTKQPKPSLASSPFMMPSAATGLQPDQRAIIDALTGRRVHKDLSGRQMGLQGVNPQLQYLLYSMRGRRHLNTSGKDVY